MDFELDEEALMYGEHERHGHSVEDEPDCDHADGNSSNEDAQTCEDELDRGISSDFAPIPENEAVSGSMGSGPMGSGPSAMGSLGRRTSAITMTNHKAQKVSFEPSEPIGGIKMGSSAPISIPGWKIRSSGSINTTPSPQDDMKQMAATFIPPHMMDAGGFDFCLDGASPSGVLKKGKLRVRNAVLRSTGFLADNQEVMAAQISAMGGTVPGRGSNGAPPMGSGLASGGLSAAMTAHQ